MSYAQYATYGLPRYVLAFLYHMESHRDCLKWNIVEGSHKLTLTLTWNFRKTKTKETLWERLQRTIGLGRNSKTDVSEDSGTPAVPRNVSHFIKHSAHGFPEVTPYKTAEIDDQGLLGLSWGFHGTKDRELHQWSKLSSQSLPGKLASGESVIVQTTGENSNSQQHMISGNSGYSSYHNLPLRASRLPVEMSLFRLSWPGTSFDALSEAVDHSTPTATTSDMTSFSMQLSPSSSLNCQSSMSCHRDSSTVCSRADDDDYITDDLTEKSSDATMTTAAGSADFMSGGCLGARRLSRLMFGCNRSEDLDFLRQLSVELLDETLVASGYGADDMAEVGRDGGKEAGSDGCLVNETVLKCLDSCDKILFRHSTTIT